MQMWTGKDLPWDVTMLEDGQRYLPPGGWTQDELADFVDKRDMAWNAACAKNVSTGAPHVAISGEGPNRSQGGSPSCWLLCNIDGLGLRAMPSLAALFASRSWYRNSCNDGWNVPRRCNLALCRHMSMSLEHCSTQPWASAVWRSRRNPAQSGWTRQH